MRLSESQELQWVSLYTSDSKASTMNSSAYNCISRLDLADLAIFFLAMSEHLNWHRGKGSSGHFRTNQLTIFAAQTPRQRSRQRRHDVARCELRRSRLATRLAHRATRGENLHALSENSRRLARSLPVRSSTLSKLNARPRALPQKHLPESVSAWLKVRQC